MKEKYGNSNILELETSQVKIMKILFDVIKEIIITDMTIVFAKNYIKIDEHETNGQCAIYIELDTINTFEQYYCENDILPISLNASNFYKIIKTVDIKNNDMLSFFVSRENPHIFTVKIENNKTNKSFSSDIKILDGFNNSNSLKLPDIEYPDPIVIRSSIFQKMCKDMKSLSSNNAIEITTVGQQIIFKYNDGFSTQKIMMGQNLDIGSEPVKIAKGIYSLVFILLFIKATNLSHTVNIYMNDGCPLILEYTIGILGTLKVLLCDFIPEEDYDY
jgi:proliferating cell nuclear antigen PCNA